MMSSGSPPLEFVRKAFAEGGAQLEVLANLLDCPDLLPETTTDDRLFLALAEVLRLRTQVQGLQQQISSILQERERMHLLIWSELSRLASKLDTEVPPLRLLEEASIKSDPLLRAILGGGGTSTCPTSSCTDTPRETASPSDPPSRSAKRHRSVMDDPMGVESSELIDENTTTTGRSSSRAESSPSEQSYFINAWIAKQKAGHSVSKSNGPLWALNEEPWFCYVCSQEAKEPPGDHFCVGKFDSGHREGLKVFCQYCHKGTARMPDLRVHFRKIVYCRSLRAELKRIITRWHLKDETVDHPMVSERSPEEEEEEPDTSSPPTLRPETTQLVS